MYFFFSTDSFTAKHNLNTSFFYDSNESVFDGVKMIKINPETEFQKLLTISFQLLDEKFEVISRKSYILKLDVKYTKKALRLIDSFDNLKDIETEYVNIDEIKDIIIDNLKKSNHFISYYNEHHLHLLLDSLDSDATDQINVLFKDYPSKLTNIDVLQVSMPFTEKKMFPTGDRLRKPSLSEVYYWLNNNQINISNSLDSVNTLIKCFKDLNNKGLISELYPNIEYVEELIKSTLKLYIDNKK